MPRDGREDAAKPGLAPVPETQRNLLTQPLAGAQLSLPKWVLKESCFRGDLLKKEWLRVTRCVSEFTPERRLGDPEGFDRDSEGRPPHLRALVEQDFPFMFLDSDLMKLRVVVADDNPDLLRTLSSLLGTEFDVVATAADGESALRCIDDWRPDIAVLDLTMPGLDGIEIAKRAAGFTPRPAMVICSVENDPEVVEAAFQAGVEGYVFKARVVTDMIPAVKSVASGHRFISPR